MLYRGFIISVMLMVIVRTGQTSEVQEPEHDSIRIYVIDHGYHTSIAFRSAGGRYNMNDSFQAIEKVTFIEFAWGDQDFYMHDGFSIWKGAKAMLWPTSSVMHVTGFNKHPTEYFNHLDNYEVVLSIDAFQNMMQFIMHSFERSKDGRFIYLQEGLYGASGFYNSVHSYHLFYNCNNWAAEALSLAGVETFWWSGWPGGVTYYLADE